MTLILRLTQLEFQFCTELEGHSDKFTNLLSNFYPVAWFSSVSRIDFGGAEGDIKGDSATRVTVVATIITQPGAPAPGNRFNLH